MPSSLTSLLHHQLYPSVSRSVLLLLRLVSKGLVKCIVHHGGQIVYTRATKEADVIVE
uniref:40S ribosomal protein S25 n=1 Tax=Heterorhabditis bacteriophora TaxID=37862 RepID=A0A1I7XDV3_HETBA